MTLASTLQELYYYADKESLEFCDAFLETDKTTSGVELSWNVMGTALPVNVSLEMTAEIVDAADEAYGKSYFYFRYYLYRNSELIADGKGKRVIQPRDHYNKKGRSFL